MERMNQNFFRSLFLGFILAFIGLAEASAFSPCQQTLSKLSDRLWETYHLEPSTSNHEELLQYYKPVALFFAKNLASRIPHGIDIDDLIQEGWMALSNEISKFDSTKGVSFNSFVSQRVRGAMLDFIRRNDPLVRRIRERDKVVREIKESLRKETGREASDEEVLAELGRSYQSNEAEKIWADHRLAIQFSSLDAVASADVKSGGGKDISLKDALNDQKIGNPGLDLERADSWNFLLKNFKPRVAEAVRLFFLEDLTQYEVAERMGVDQSRVSQLLKEAKKEFEKMGVDQVESVLYGRSKVNQEQPNNEELLDRYFDVGASE